jgi:hypothetical protein
MDKILVETGSDFHFGCILRRKIRKVALCPRAWIGPNGLLLEGARSDFDVAIVRIEVSDIMMAEDAAEGKKYNVCVLRK